MVLILLTFNSNVLAYGSGGGSKKTCAKPKFSKFIPENLAVVEPQAEFSFVASAQTNPKSIEVSVKKQAVEIAIEKVGSSYSVSGKLPDTLVGTFARVVIKGVGMNNCPATDGWLLKIESQTP